MKTIFFKLLLILFILLAIILLYQPTKEKDSLYKGKENEDVYVSVKVGDTLVEFDMNAIKNEGYELITPVIITNTMEYLEIVPKDIKSVNTGETLITIL